MSGIEVREVSGFFGREKFIKFPWELKGNTEDPQWVPPLRMENRLRMSEKMNPFFKKARVKYFIAYEGGKPVGRISAHISERFNEFQKSKWGFFGWFEAVDRKEVAQALFERAEKQIADWGMEACVGPFNYTTNDECGLLVDGFDTPPMFLMTHNPQYYQALIESAGYEKAHDLLAYRLDTVVDPPEGIVKIAEGIRSRPDVKFRTWDIKNNLRQELEAFHDIYNAAWNRNWGFVPLAKEELLSHEFEFKFLLDEEIAFMAEINGEPAGFSLSLPNLNEAIQLMNGKTNPVTIWKFIKAMKKVQSLRVFALGVKPEHRTVGVASVFYIDTLMVAKRRGYKWGEMSWILESNDAMNRAIMAMGGTVYKTYRIFKKDLN